MKYAYGGGGGTPTSRDFCRRRASGCEHRVATEIKEKSAVWFPLSGILRRYIR